MIKVNRYILCVWVVLIILALVLFINSNKSQVNKEAESIIANTDEYINYGYEYGYYTPEYIEKKFGVSDLTNEEYEQMLYYDKHIYEMLLKMTEKGNSWKCFPVLKSIKDRYDEKEGILAEYDFDSVEYSQETLDLLAENGSTSPICFIITKGKKKTKIYFRILMDGGLDELEKERVVNLTDIDGNELDTRIICNESNFEEVVWQLLDLGNQAIKEIAVTKKFEEKYNNIEDAISKNLTTHSSGYSIGYKSIDNNDKSAIYYWKSNGIRYLVNVKFIFDSNNYVDDVQVSLLGKD